MKRAIKLGVLLVTLAAIMVWALAADEGYENYNNEVRAAFTTLNDNVRVYATTANAAPGEYVDINIRLDENSGITMLFLNVSYNSAVLERVGLTAGDTMLLPQPPPTDANPFNTNFELADPTGVSTATGNLATIRFRVRDYAPVGATPVTISVSSAYVAYGFVFNAVNVSVSNGLVNVTAPQEEPTPTPTATPTATPTPPTPSPSPAPPTPSPSPTPHITIAIVLNAAPGQLDGSGYITWLRPIGETVNSLPTPTRAGYTFAGWTIDGNAVNLPYTFNANTTLQATWTAIVAPSPSPSPTPTPTPSPSPTPGPSATPAPSNIPPGLPTHQPLPIPQDPPTHQPPPLVHQANDPTPKPTLSISASQSLWQ
ncbi:MAG: cohesin domain-containing protein [Defluviitaleaceae bacterium]|nr:cohesin domain-containing protein [Defluviitaleaceae bacterium]